MPTRTLESIQGWCSPTLRLKERMRAIKGRNHRMTESRIVEEALIKYLPELEQSFGIPIHGPHGRRRRAA